MPSAGGAARCRSGWESWCSRPSWNVCGVCHHGGVVITGICTLATPCLCFGLFKRESASYKNHMLSSLRLSDAVVRLNGGSSYGGRNLEARESPRLPPALPAPLSPGEGFRGKSQVLTTYPVARRRQEQVMTRDDQEGTARASISGSTWCCGGGRSAPATHSSNTELQTRGRRAKPTAPVRKAGWSPQRGPKT